MQTFELTHEHIALLRAAKVSPNGLVQTVDYTRGCNCETATALQIVLATGAFEVGVYEADDYKRNWKAV